MQIIIQTNPILYLSDLTKYFWVLAMNDMILNVGIDWQLGQKHAPLSAKSPDSPQNASDLCRSHFADETLLSQEYS